MPLILQKIGVFLLMLSLGVSYDPEQKTAPESAQIHIESRRILDDFPIVSEVSQSQRDFIWPREQVIAVKKQTVTPTLEPTPVPVPVVIPRPGVFSNSSMEWKKWFEVGPQPYVRRESNSVPACYENTPVSHKTWMASYPQHIVGKASYYGEGLMESQFEYRGVDPTRYLGGVAMMSPVAMLSTIWLKPPHTGVWEGPYISVDASQREHFCMNVYQRGLAVEVSYETWKRWGRSGGPYDGVEVWIGGSPGEGVPEIYWPELIWRGMP